MWISNLGQTSDRRFRSWCHGVATAAVLSTFTTTPIHAELSDAAFEERVRAYILGNPELILEALNLLSQREKRAAVQAKTANYPELFEDPAVLGLGPENAAITVVEFFDYRCVPCKTLHPKLTAALADHPEIRVEMRQLPILSPGSERAARFALAVRNVSGPSFYAKVHDDIWAIKGPLNEPAFKKIAELRGLDWIAIKTEMGSDAVSARIARNRDIAIDLEILGTPAFVTPTSVSFGQSDAEALVAGWLSQ